jgi:hypothetical protein
MKKVIFEQKIYVCLKKPNKTHFKVGFCWVFLGGFFLGFIGRVFWAGFLLPTLV